MSACVICDGAVPPPKPRGQQPKYCGERCRLEARRIQREALKRDQPELVREKNRVKQAKWRRTQQTSFRTYRRQHYAERKGQISSYRKQYRAENAEQFRAYGRQRYEKNRNHIRDQRLRNYREREHLRTANQRGAAKRRAVELQAFVEVVDPLVVFERDKGVCMICSLPVDRAGAWEIDHKVPLSKGGEHSYANTQLAHRSCNRSKGARVAS